MAASRYKSQVRDSGGFVALPWSVMDSAAYLGLSVHARALLLEIARQLRGDNNGSLLCSRAYMATRGWKSADMLSKCKAELLASNLLHETVMGHRPNKASWYAVTWLGLDKLAGYDEGAEQAFVRGAYKAAALPPPKPSREQLYDRWRTVTRHAPSVTQS